VTRTTQDAEKYLFFVHRLGFASSRKIARSQFEDLFDGIELDKKRILDIGGGSGVYSFYAANMGAAEVVCLEPEGEGSDWSATWVFDRIRSECPDAPVRLDTRTIQEYTASETFDVVLMRASINHIDENGCIHLLDDKRAWDRYREVFTLIGALVAPGGKLVISDCTRHNFFAMLGLKNPLCPAIEWRKHHAPEVWARLLTEAGFRDPRISWDPLYRLGKPGRFLSRNKAAAYFLKGIFRLEMTKV
jgi:SAM-dependent methyltransferase